MSNRPEILVKVENALRETELDLIERRNRVLRFTQSEHTSDENLQLRAEVIDAQTTLDELLKTVLENKNIAVEFRVEAEGLCSRCRDMNSYTRDMFRELSYDLRLRQGFEEKQAAEIAKKTPTDYAMKFSALLGLPAVLMGVVDKLGGTKTQVGEAAGAGFAVTGIYFYKDLKKDENLKGMISKTPFLVKSGLRWIYYSEPVMNTRIGTKLTFRSSADAFGNRFPKTSKRVRRIMNRVSRKDSPKP